MKVVIKIFPKAFCCTVAQKKSPVLVNKVQPDEALRACFLESEVSLQISTAIYYRRKRVAAFRRVADTNSRVRMNVVVNARRSTVITVNI
jgi:hypothetical protein